MAATGFDNSGHHITAMKIVTTNGAGIVLYGYRRSFQGRGTATDIHRQNNRICEIRDTG